MNAKKAKKFRRQRADELRQLARILQEAGVIRDDGPLRSAANLCGKDHKGLAWGYGFAGLSFELTKSELRHTRPKFAKLDSVELGVSLSGSCLDEGVEDDPFTMLNINIVIRGLDANSNELAIAWHLDKHDGGDSKFYHPNYHFHCGGEKIWECEISIKDFSYGSLLLLESPRLDHKPLDGILAVDFVLAIFTGSVWHKLKTEDDRYTDLVREAEKRCHYAYCNAALTHLQG